MDIAENIFKILTPKRLVRLPDIETLEDAGLIGRASEALPGGDALAFELRGVLGLSSDDEDEPEEDAAQG